MENSARAAEAAEIAEIASFSSIVHICLLLSNYADTHTGTHSHISINYFYDSHKAHKILSHASILSLSPSLSLVMTDANIWFNFDRRSQALFSPAYFLLGNSCQQLPIALHISIYHIYPYYTTYTYRSQGSQVSFLFCIFTYFTFN